MITYSLSDFIASMSQNEFTLLHKRWVLYAARLIASHKCEKRIDPIEVVGETFYLVASSSNVNRRCNGTPYRLPKGTPASGCIGSARVGPELSI